MRRILNLILGVVFGVLLISSEIVLANPSGQGVGGSLNGSGQSLVGWVESGGKWLYYKGGQKVTGWQKLRWSQGEDWFYFNSSGEMLANTDTPDGYHVDGNGVWDGKNKKSGTNSSGASGRTEDVNSGPGVSGSSGSRGSSSLSSGTTVSTSGGSAILGDSADCGGDFLGFRPWYKGLTTSDCQIGKPNNISLFVWTIVLNILFDLFLGVGFTALGFIIYGGFKYLMSGGDAGKVASGKKIITAALIGLAIAMMSTIIVNTIIGVLKG